jgi:hypothetical protein
MFRENALNYERKRETCHQTAEEGKTTQDIGKEIHISFKDIGKITHKVIGDDSQVGGEKNEKEKRSLSPYVKAFKMFKDKNPFADIAIELDVILSIIVFYHYRIRF